MSMSQLIRWSEEEVAESLSMTHGCKRFKDKSIKCKDLPPYSFWETCILKFVGIYASKRKMGRCTLHSIQLRGKNLGEILGHFELKGSTHFLGNL